MYVLIVRTSTSLLNLLSQAALQSHLKEYLCEPKLRGFRSACGKVMFSRKMRTAFASCVGDLVAIPVEAGPGEAPPRYVLEIDVTPSSSVCGDLVFSYCDSEGRKVSYIREGEACVEERDYRGRRGKGECFRGEIKDRADRRRRRELAAGTTELKALEDRISFLRRAEESLLIRRKQDLYIQMMNAGGVGLSGHVTFNGGVQYACVFHPQTDVRLDQMDEEDLV